MKTLRILVLTLVWMMIASCSKKEVFLPQVPVSGKSNIENHSEIWVFYNEKAKDSKAELNKNNLITSTNWILNIDRRLKMYEVIPVFQMAHAKRAKKSLHSVDGMIDYISYSNTKDRNISVFPMHDKKYLLLTWDELQKLNQEKICPNEMIFYQDRVKINGLIFNSNEYLDQLKKLKKGCVQLIFDSKINYQQYMMYRLETEDRLPANNSLAPTEYFFK